MTQFTITKGSRQVIVTQQGGNYSARLYVNHGETATDISYQCKTERGARRFAEKVLAA